MDYAAVWINCRICGNLFDRGNVFSSTCSHECTEAYCSGYADKVEKPCDPKTILKLKNDTLLKEKQTIKNLHKEKKMNKKKYTSPRKAQRKFKKEEG